MKKLLSFGELLIDMLPHDDQNSAYSPIPGGAPANVAVGYKKLGGSAYFCGGLGNDNFGIKLCDTLKEYEVNTDYLFKIASAQTAVVIVSLDEHAERSFNFYRDKTADLLIDQSHLEQIQWQDFSVFHFCSNTLTDSHIAHTTLSALKLARQHNTLVSFDVNLRYSLWQDTTHISDAVARCYRHCDIVKLSLDELNFLAEQENTTADNYINDVLADNVKLIFVTDGPNPAKAITKTGVIEHPAPNIKAIDTTSAGDAFIAGVLYYLHHHNDDLTVNEKIENHAIITQAMAFGLKCGSKACLKKGAFPALPYLDELN